MTDKVLALCQRLEDARDRHEAFHEQLDEPLEPGTPEHDQAAALLKEVHDLLEELGRTTPGSARGAELMAIAVMAHAGALRPSVYHMLAQILHFLTAAANEENGGCICWQGPGRSETAAD